MKNRELKELKIGETQKLDNGDLIQCIESTNLVEDCYSCYFAEYRCIENMKSIMFCSISGRKDQKSVLYKKVDQ
jgi:hypothetical protein